MREQQAVFAAEADGSTYGESAATARLWETRLARGFELDPTILRDDDDYEDDYRYSTALRNTTRKELITLIQGWFKEARALKRKEKRK